MTEMDYTTARLEIYIDLVDAVDLMEEADQPTLEMVDEYTSVLMQTFGGDHAELVIAVNEWLDEARVHAPGPLRALPDSMELRYRVAEIKARSSPRGETDEEKDQRLIRLAQLNRDMKDWVNKQEPPRHKHKVTRGMPVRCDENCPYQTWRDRLKKQIKEKFLDEIDSLSAASTQLKFCRCDAGFVQSVEGRVEPCRRCRPMQYRHSSVCVPRGLNVKNCDCREATAYGAQ